MSSALALHAPEALPPLPPPDRLAERQRRAAVQSEPQLSKVDRSELARALNATDDERIAAHIQRAREHIETEDAHERLEQAAKAPLAQRLTPHRRERPVSKADTPQTRIHREARVMMQAIVNSRGGYVIQFYLFKLRAIFSGQPLAKLRAAALEPQPQGGCRWTYADEGARRRIAIGLFFLCCGRWTNQRTAFGSRSTRRGLVIAGLNVDRLLRMAKPVGRRRYDRHTFGSRGSSSSPWLGDMALFEKHGFAIRKRLPKARCNSWEIGPSGQAMNRYWIGCVVSNRNPKREQRNRVVTSLGEALGVVAFDPSAHVVGWEWATEQPFYAPSLRAAPS